jgi:hypothetical protein
VTDEREDGNARTTDVADVIVSNAAVEFLRARGGALYVWIDSAGLLQSRTRPPSELVHWDDRNADGVRIRLAPDLPRVRYWRFELRRFPWKHIDATSSDSPPPASLLDAVLSQPW